MDSNAIQIVQLPIIREKLQPLKAKVDQRVTNSSALVCTEETVQAVKKDRTANRELTAYIKVQLKKAEEILLAQFVPIKEYCEKELLAPLEKLDEKQKADISEIEDGVIKARCEERLRDYFAELCAVHHVEWLRYEDSGIKVDMASAKAKTPKKLRKQLLEFVVRVSNDVTTIAEMEDANEVLVEYKESLNLGRSIATVCDRHKRIESVSKENDARKETFNLEAETVRRVEVLAAPTVVEDEPTYQCTFTVTATMAQLREIKAFFEERGITYTNGGGNSDG